MSWFFTSGGRKSGIDDLMQSRNRDKNIENKLMDTKEGRKVDKLGDWDVHIYTADR